jgi:hypothetical protein
MAPATKRLGPKQPERCESLLAAAIIRAHGVLALTDWQVLVSFDSCRSDLSVTRWMNHDIE